MDTFEFPEDYQDLLIAYALRRVECRFFLRLLKPQFFTDSIATACWHAVLQHYAATAEVPVFQVLSQRVCERLSAQNREPAAGQEYVRTLARMDTAGDLEYVLSSVEAFAKRQAMLVAIRAAIEGYKEGKSPDAAMLQQFEAAVSLKREADDIGIVFHQDSDAVIDRLANKAIGVKTGFAQLDSIWRRGWEPGWLIVPLAPPKRYKSIWCVNLALSMVSPSVGADVFYYPCEISADLTVARMHSNITGLAQDDAYLDVANLRRSVRRALEETCAGNLVVKDFPSKSVTINDIKAHAKMVIRETGIKPKAIFIDYAETIVPSDTKISEHQQQANIYVEARSMGKELGCCVIMPDRCNKEAVGMPVPSMKSFQGAFQKAGAVDIAIGLCASDEEYEQNILRSFVFLNRHGKAFQHFRGSVDAALARVRIGDMIETPVSELFADSEPGRKKRKSETKALRDEVLDEEDRLGADVAARANAVRG